MEIPVVVFPVFSVSLRLSTKSLSCQQLYGENNERKLWYDLSYLCETFLRSQLHCIYIYLSEVVNLTWWRFSPKLHIVGFSLFLLLFLCGEFNVMKMWRFSPKHVFWGVPFYCTCEVSLPVESIFVLSCGQVVQCDCSGFLLLFWLFGVFIIILIWNIFSYYLWSMERWVKDGYDSWKKHLLYILNSIHDSFSVYTSTVAVAICVCFFGCSH